MVDLQHQLDDALDRLRRAGTDLRTVEVKAAAGGLPRSIAQSVCAFANSAGGLIILGLSEPDAFAPVGIDARKIAADLGSACADQLIPPIRADIDILAVGASAVVVAWVPELPSDQKPCFVEARGMDRGSYVRTHDGDRQLTTYEVHVLEASRGQPLDDRAIVAGASTADLDEQLIAALVRRLRATRGSVFANAGDDEILKMMGVVTTTEDGDAVTLAGLLALGRFPQQFYPQLDVTFVAYPSATGEPLADGTRFLDNQSIDGPIPAMVAETLIALRRNMKRRSIVVGLGREDRWEYPEEAVREIVANALMHRDFHPLAHGTQVRISLYPDRLEVTSPGGLHGPIAREDLLAEPVSSSRNATLAKLLEDVEVGSSGRTICENRGSGLLATAAALRGAGMEPPVITDTVREFRVAIKNHGLLDEAAVAWLSGIDTAGLTDRQRLGLAFLHRRGQITNQDYRSLTGTDPLTATRELTGLGTTGLIEKTNDRRWTVWVLAGAARSAPGPALFDLGEEPASSRRDRRPEIRAILGEGPLSAQAIAERLGLSKEGVLKWLRRMEAEGEVAPTSAKRRSKNNTWQLR
ncbi:ATP-binding protein [Sporichthya sp.]|uniref:ATP-binding protein n=1 Tax=Sporichthya sp. TaxID=65475 RepID=UPI00182A0FE0|nr:ATP-binding protein [Sporichthya sp.]MBA3743932.1 putative DNA binding domain-containing protein [Sporichthya sp.]